MILMYHGVVPDDAPPARSGNGQAIPVSGLRLQLEWLRRRREVVPLDDYLREVGRSARASRRIAALTFDDGLGTTFRMLDPLVREMALPATLFVSTSHLNAGPLLWFSYLNALCFESDATEIVVGGQRFPLRSGADRRRSRRALETLAASGGDPAAFVRKLESEYPLPPRLVREYAGMTHAEVAAAGGSALWQVGAHSVTHPWLSRQTNELQAREIDESRGVLALWTGRPVRYFAYPGGDYDLRTLQLLRDRGFEAGFATLPKDLGTDPRFEIGRIGVYSASLGKMRLKVMGVASVARGLGIRVG